MNTTRMTLILTFVGIFGMSACRDKLPCTDCDEDIAENDDNRVPDLPRADLPCGGADLMTDNLNCGACGHECVVYYPGTPYEAGGCQAGVCGPGGWSDCIPKGLVGPDENCAKICGVFDTDCVPNGCAGLTGLVFEVNLDGWGCGADSYEPVATVSGCEEPIPWLSTDEWQDIQCCCAFQ